MARKFPQILTTLVAVAALPLSALADPITIVPITGGYDGGWVGTYAMTDVDQFAETTSGNTVDCVGSPTLIGGNICFQGKNGAASDVVIVNNPTWWQYAHGNVYVTNQSWIEILLPANTLAVSFWVGASFGGTAWVQAENANGAMTSRSSFSVRSGSTSGYGAYVSQGCSYLSKIIIEPQDWGFGNLSINQGQCTSVPEPAPLALLALGLLGLGLSRRIT